jgi:hypothetical protein
MVDLLLVRRLQAWTSNIGRRLIRAPKTFVRDSGLSHALLRIGTMDDLLGHPVLGRSWEGFVIENILSTISADVQAGYYRTAGGAEIDLVLEISHTELWAIQIKRSSAPTVSKGFYSACEDLMPSQKFVVHSGQDKFPLGHGILAVSLPQFLEQISSE